MGLGDVFKKYAEGLLERENPGFRETQRLRKAQASRAEFEAQNAPVEAARQERESQSRLESAAAQRTTEGLQQAGLRDQIEETARQRARLIKAHQAGLIPSEDLKLAEFMLRQKENELTQRMHRQSLAVSERQFANMPTPAEAKQAREEASGLRRSQKAATDALANNRQAGVDRFAPSMISKEERAAAEEWAKGQIKRGTPGLFSRLHLGRQLGAAGPPMPSLSPLSPEQDTSTPEYQKKVGELMKQYLETRYGQGSLTRSGVPGAEAPPRVPAPGTRVRGPNGQVMQWVPDAGADTSNEDDLF